VAIKGIAEQRRVVQHKPETSKNLADLVVL